MSKRSQSVCLAVLPFEQLSDGEGPEYFARGFLEDLITELSRFATLEVISPKTAEQIASRKNPDQAAEELDVDYFLRGSLRRSGGRLRINTRLVEPGRNSVVWAERYDAPLDSIFEIQDDITSQVVSALSVQIEGSRLAIARRKPVAELAAYDCWLRGMEHLRRGTLEDDEEARRFFRQALEIEPGNARAFAGLSLSYFNEWSCQVWNLWEESEANAFEYAARAIELDEADHVIQFVLGRIHLFRRQFDQARLHVGRAYELNPNDADNLVQIANCHAYLGETERAIELMEKALRLNPYHDSWYYAYGAMSHFIRREYETALEMARRAGTDLMVDLSAFMGAALAYSGRREEAADHIQRFRDTFVEKISYGERVDDEEMLAWILRVNPYRHQEHADHLEEGLRRAGLGAQTGAVSSMPAAPGSAVFRAASGVRHMSFDGTDAQLPEIKGFGDIASLLERPGQEVHSAELYGDISGSDGTEMLDDRAKQEYRTRIEELEQELAEAERMNDLGRASAFRSELEQLIAYLDKAFGLGGRPRRLGSMNERARSAVTQRIRSAIGKIAAAHPSLGEHLSQSIRTGTFCCYEPSDEVRWTL